MTTAKAPFLHVIDRARKAMDTPAARQAAAEVRASRERARRHALEALAVEIGIPTEDSLAKVVFDDNATQTPAMHAFLEVLTWRAGRRSRTPVIRIVAGKPGVGKTAAVSWAILRTELSATFATADEIARTPSNGWGPNGAKHAVRWDRWLNAVVLAIDDLGTESGEPGVITELLLSRYNRGLVTLATSNNSRADLSKRYRSERLADRLANGQEIGRGLPWHVLVRGLSLRDPANLVSIPVDPRVTAGEGVL